jgi:hypothetical protein
MVPIIIGSKRQFEGADPAFVLQCPGCEQETVWVDMQYAKSISIDLVPLQTGTAHTVVCSECLLSTPISDQVLSWLRSLTSTRSGAPLEECAGPTVAGLGVAWLEEREREFVAKLRKALPPLHAESRRLQQLRVPDETTRHLLSGDDESRRADTIMAVIADDDPDLTEAIATLISKLDPDVRRFIFKRIGAKGTSLHVALLQQVRSDDNRRLAKAIDSAVTRLSTKNT